MKKVKNSKKSPKTTAMKKLIQLVILLKDG